MKAPKHLLLLLILVAFAATPAAAQTSEAEKSDYLIVVSNSRDKAANEKVLSEVKDKYKDAALYYDADTRQYYVYVERYYSKSGADFAVYWLKKNRPNLPKVWAKVVPSGSK